MSSIAKAVVRAYENYINGKWVKSSSGEMFPVYDPSTEEVIAQVASSNAADIDLAVRAARAAFDSGPWATTTAQDRGRILFKLAEKSGRTRLISRSWSAAIQENPSSKRNTTSPMSRPASNITAASRTKSPATSIRFLRTR